MSHEQLCLRRSVLRLSRQMLGVAGAAVAAALLVNLPSLPALETPVLIRAVALTTAAAVGMAMVAVAAVTLLVLRRRRPDPVVELLSRHYRQLLDESSLNPSRRPS